MLFAGDVCMNLMGLGDPVGFEILKEGRASQHKLASLSFDAAGFGHGGPIARDASTRFPNKWGKKSPASQVACVKFSKKKSEKMCRIRFGFFEKRAIAFRLALPLPPNRVGLADSAPNLIGLLSRTFKNDGWLFMPQPIPSRAAGFFSVRPAVPY